MDWCIAIMGWLKDILSSPTVIAVVLAAVIAPWTAVKTYLSQQRIARVQRIYYEESLLDQLRHLDDALDIATRNFALFDNAINFITNANGMPLVNNILITSVTEIANKIAIPPRYQSSKREALITLFKRRGYPVYQWLLKFDDDFIELNSLMRERVFGLALDIQQGGDLQQVRLRAISRQIAALQPLLARHQILVYLFNTIVAKIGTMDFESLEDLAGVVVGDQEIRDTLEKMDVVYKILFGYYDLGNNTFLSFLTDEDGQKYKLTFNNPPIIERIDVPDQIDQATLVIVKRDEILAEMSVNINGEARRYPLVQIGVANLTALNERPSFYRDIPSFW